ncbi:MAG: hypothetical protein HY049_19545 [Acidobacteria bacterium]|nr:hypothetical protein [Acidobacteriota bacterium]
MVLVAALALTSMPPPAVSQTEDGSDPAVAVPLVETTSVTLTLFDVEAVGKNGRPMRGLKKKDFVVRLDGRLWPIYSVDDSCACQDSAPGDATTVAHAGSAPELQKTGAPAAPASPPGEFVIYIDFSQLQLDGRARVRSEVTRWIRETMGPGDQVMIEGYSSSDGLREIRAFTGDRASLVAAIDRAYADRSLLDEFPDLLESRVEECRHYPRVCPGYAMEEFEHGRRSLNVLKKFLDRFDDRSGRRTLLFFQQNGAMSPGRFYGRETPTQYADLEEVAASASSAHTVVYPINAAPLPVGVGLDSVTEILEEETLAMASPLADFTGGKYNKGPGDLSRLTDEAARGCRCLYRIALRPPEKQGRRIYDVKITAAGVSLPHAYRVRFLGDADRWMANAQAVLLNPGEARDVEVGAAIVPRSASARGWDADVEVSVALDSLALIPGALGQVGTYEVGALMSRLDGNERWELLGNYKVSRDREGETGRVALHRRTITRLRPGRYRLAAFARDRTVNLFGGAEGLVDLPEPAKPGSAGPVVMRASRRTIVAALPLSGETKAEIAGAGTGEEGSIPAGVGMIARGEPLSLETWICSGGEHPPASAVRYVSRKEIPIFRFESTEPAPTGRCLHFSDRVDTSSIEAGNYQYHIRWAPEPGAAERDTEAPFDVTGRGGS